MLAELVFGGEDVREVVYRSLDICDEGFVAFLEKKIEVSTDLEERSAFRSLIDIVGAVRKAAEKAKVGGWVVPSCILLSFLLSYGEAVKWLCWVYDHRRRPRPWQRRT